jgi:hypothetical protein
MVQRPGQIIARVAGGEVERVRGIEKERTGETAKHLLQVTAEVLSKTGATRRVDRRWVDLHLTTAPRKREGRD